MGEAVGSPTARRQKVKLTPSKESGFRTEAPSIVLKTSGDVIRGVGERFANNPLVGAGLMTMPFATSPDHSGFVPEFSLFYYSVAGNGPFGLGGILALPVIARETNKGRPSLRMRQNRIYSFSQAPKVYFSASIGNTDE